jgi:hypothetical protein
MLKESLLLLLFFGSTMVASHRLLPHGAGGSSKSFSPFNRSYYYGSERERRTHPIRNKKDINRDTFPFPLYPAPPMCLSPDGFSCIGPEGK